MTNATKTPWLGLLFILLICLGFLFAEMINNRLWLSDFEVYYKAANRLMNAQNLYRHAEDGHYIFKYSPVSAVVFIPFTVFSFTVAKVVYWLFLTAIIALNIYLVVKLIYRNSHKPGFHPKSINTLYILAAVITALHFLRELHLGQVNYLLLFIYVLALLLFIQKNEIRAALLLSLSIFIKPFGLIFLPYLLYRKKLKALTIILLASMVWALVPLLFYGNWNIFIQQYTSWFHELSVELGNKQHLLADANHTVFSVIARHTPFRYMLTNPDIVPFYQATILLLIVFFLYKTFKLSSKTNLVNNTVFDFYLLIACIPLLAFTSENAFVFELPLVITVLFYFKLLSTLAKTMAIISFVFIGGNFAELLGRPLSAFLDDHSFVTIGTLLLLTVYYRVLLKLHKLPQEINSAV